MKGMDMILKKRIGFLFVLAVLMITLTAGCGSEKTAENKPEEKALPPLVVGVMPDVDSLPLIFARELGYFKAEGVDVKIEQFKSAVDRDAAIQAGAVDGAISDMLAVAFFREGGVDVKITSLTNGNYRVIGAANEPAKTMKELVGKDVAVSRNTIIEFITDSALAREGLAAESVNKKAIPKIPARLEMLAAGQLNAATLPEPIATLAIKDGGHVIVDAADMGMNPGIMMFTGKALKEKKASIAAMYRAYDRAVKYLTETPAKEYMQTVINKGGFPATVKEGIDLPKYQIMTMPGEQDWQHCQKWLLDKKLTTKQLEFKDVIENISAK